MNTMLIIIACLLGAYIVYRVKTKQALPLPLPIPLPKIIPLLRPEFYQLVLSDDKSAIKLFTRPPSATETLIALDDIKQCTLQLGDNTIATINNTIDHGFNDHKERQLRAIFHDEQVTKMVDGKVRRVSLTFKVSDKEKYRVCLYLRKGSDRITKQSYFSVIDDAIDWCWFFSQHLNSEQTGDRIIKPKLTAEEIAKAEHKTYDKTPLHAQAAYIRPATSAKSTVNDASENENGDNQEESIELDSSQTASNTVVDLNKLIELHQQGFLSDKEFSQEKSKLLTSPDTTE